MTIGKQFENTFWVDPKTGEEHSWTRGKLQDNTYPHHQIDAAELIASPERPLQGLLFHPATGTGLKDDPMVPPDARKGIIQRALDLTSPERYRQNLKSLLKFTTRSHISTTLAETHINRLTDTMNNSDVPSHVLERVTNPIRTVLDPIPGRAWAEANGTGIRMTSPNERNFKTITTTETVHVPSETPIANPNFWDQLDKARSRVARGDDHNSISADDTFGLASHWVNPQTGHIMTKDFAKNLPIDESVDPPGESVENGLATPALVLKTFGYVPNLFPGTGNPTSKNYAIGEVGKIETGYGEWDRGRPYTHATFHNRMTPGSTEERKVTKRVKHTPSLSERTMTHELGHALDVNIKSDTTNRGSYIIGQDKRTRRVRTAKADPMEEGVADASADRYTRYKGQFQDVLANTEKRAEDFRGTGYTVGYSGWKNQTHRALYAATRFHTALSDEQTQQIPSRDQIFKNLPKPSQREINRLGSRENTNAYHDALNSLALGHIVHNMPHVHGVLKQLGLDKAATTAHEYYKKHMGLIAPKQPTLPGMEDFV
jgi:hypothetical protein